MGNDVIDVWVRDYTRPDGDEKCSFTSSYLELDDLLNEYHQSQHYLVKEKFNEYEDDIPLDFVICDVQDVKDGERMCDEKIEEIKEDIYWFVITNTDKETKNKIQNEKVLNKFI